MRAIVITENGGPEVLTAGERPDPEPGPGEVLIDVAAAGVNFIDVYFRTGAYPQKLPYTPGVEAAGTVAAVGEGVTEFSAGDRVAWANVQGAYAERAVVPADKVVPVPEEVSLEDAAASLLQGMTAHYLTRSTYPIQEGDTVLVHAAAGGMGLLLTQVATSLGARVIGTASTPEKEKLAKDAGADVTMGYDGFPEKVRELTGGEGVAVVYDGVGAPTFDGEPGQPPPPRRPGPVRRRRRAGAAVRSAAPQRGRIGVPHAAVPRPLHRGPHGTARARRRRLRMGEVGHSADPRRAPLRPRGRRRRARGPGVQAQHGQAPDPSLTGAPASPGSLRVGTDRRSAEERRPP